MKKCDLKTGMVVETRCGLTYIVRKSDLLGEGIFCLGNSHMRIGNYTQNLTYIANNKYDIMFVKVLGAACNTEFLLRSDRESELIYASTQILWERVEVKEMTVAQIEKELGITNLKIVK